MSAHAARSPRPHLDRDDPALEPERERVPA